MSKRTLIADAIRAERVNSVTTNNLARQLTVRIANNPTEAKADTAIPVGALYVSLEDMIVRYKNEQT